MIALSWNTLFIAFRTWQLGIYIRKEVFITCEINYSWFYRKIITCARLYELVKAVLRQLEKTTFEARLPEGFCATIGFIYFTSAPHMSHTCVELWLLVWSLRITYQSSFESFGNRQSMFYVTASVMWLEHLDVVDKSLEPVDCYQMLQSVSLLEVCNSLLPMSNTFLLLTFACWYFCFRKWRKCLIIELRTLPCPHIATASCHRVVV